jgi:glucose/arabinose dehydrogenase
MFAEVTSRTNHYDAAFPGLRKARGWRAPRLGALCILLLMPLWPCALHGAEYRVETIAGGLRWPWSVARLPAGGFLITEREGRLLHLHDSGSRRTISGTPDTLFAGQGGFLDVVLHPRFASNRILYLSYAEGREDSNGTAVFRARLEGDGLVDGERILRITPDKTTAQHYGGRMLFLPDGSLLLTSGEGFDHREAAQSLTSELGKVLRVTDEGDAYRFNPFPQKGAERIWSYGHRNPQGLAFDPVTETVYLHEHGPRGGDEVNVLRRGLNYGWPAVTHGIDYSGAYVSPFSRAPDMEDPLWIWVPSIAPSGLAVYRGSDFPAWEGSLLLGALVDRELRRLTLRNGKVVAEEALLGELGERIRDVRVFDGQVFVLTDGEDARLLRLMPN